MKLFRSLLVVDDPCAMQGSGVFFGDVRTNNIMVKQDLSFNDRYIVARNID